MPELRRDPIIGRWVIIATDRAERPTDFEHVPPKSRGAACPFCPTHEKETPPEILAIRERGSKPNEPGWFVRVVANKYPALQIEGDLDRRAEGIYDKMRGVGAHEVVIESPEHQADLSTLPEEQIGRVLRAYRARMLDLAGDQRFRYIQVFKNHGRAAGATLEHPHTQLIATPIVPRRILEEMKGCAQHYDLKERCIFCDIVAQELESGHRVVTANEDYVTIAPFAPRFPFETWLLPKTHRPAFEQTPDAQIDALARQLKDTLSRIRGALQNPAYNFVIHTSPCNDGRTPRPYHWHIEIMPKVSEVAGFEWGTGFYIITVPPEEYAAVLRMAPRG